MLYFGADVDQSCLFTLLMSAHAAYVRCRPTSTPQSKYTVENVLCACAVHTRVWCSGYSAARVEIPFPDIWNVKWLVKLTSQCHKHTYVCVERRNAIDYKHNYINPRLRHFQDDVDMMPINSRNQWTFKGNTTKVYIDMWGRGAGSMGFKKPQKIYLKMKVHSDRTT